MYNNGNSSKNVTGASVVDGTLYTVDIADDAVTADKLANTVNADIATGVSGSTTAGDALPKAGGALTGAVTTTSTFDGRDVATDGSKLDGIEASADVTDTANVTSSGALMDSEVTNLAQVKAFDTTDYATSTQGTTADNALPKAGGTMTGTIAGFTSTGIDDNATSTAITIDSSGRVTTPNQPAFYVQNNDAFNAGTGVFPYPAVVTNVGSHYSTATNRFTAPVAGTYLFEVSFFTNITNAPIDFRINKNGAAAGGNASTGTHSLARGAHAGAVLTLAASDYIDVIAAGYGINTPAGLGVFQTFRGHLIG